MVIGTDTELELGGVYIGVTGTEPGSEYRSQPYRVVAPADRTAWVMGCIRANPDLLFFRFGHCRYYYEVASD